MGRADRVKAGAPAIAAICAEFLFAAATGGRTVGSSPCAAPLRLQRRGGGLACRGRPDAPRSGGRPHRRLTNWQALVLGLVQGLTELLPISSSGHLILVPWVADWTYLEEHDAFNQTFDVALHLGTLVAVVAYFWSDFVAPRRCVVRLSVRRRAGRDADERIAWFVVVATIPAALVGAARRERDRRPPRRAVADRDPAGRLRRVLLWGRPAAASDRHGRPRPAARPSRWALAQSARAAAGVSRSGITITAGRFIGLDRDAAARFSFLLLVPIVARRRAPKGVHDVLLGDLPDGLDGAVPRRHARRRPRPAARDRMAARLRAPPHLRRLRRLPARPARP